MADWQANKAWSDRFIPEIKQALARHLISEAPMCEDQAHNTDLIVLRLDTVRVACRVRRFDYLEKYGGEFTLRSTLPSGHKTELTKVIEGWGDFIFYGFSDQLETMLSRWFLGDLSVFRLWLARSILRHKTMPGFPQSNGDNSSQFIAFSLDCMPREFVVDSFGWSAT